MEKNYAFFDIYQYFGINKNKPFNEVKKDIEKRLEKFSELVFRNPTEESVRVLEKAKKAYQVLCEENHIKRTENLDDFAFYEQMLDDNRRNRMLASFNEKEKKPNYKLSEERKRNQTKNFKLKPMFTKVVAGALVVVCAFGASKAVSNHMDKENQKYNVCVEYEVQEGDTKDKLNDLFKEYGFSYFEVSGAYRDVDFVYAGDVVIGRTTKEKADELVKAGLGKIISIDEAVSLLGENNSLAGEFKAYANAKSDIAFFVPEGKVII